MLGNDFNPLSISVGRRTEPFPHLDPNKHQPEATIGSSPEGIQETFLLTFLLFPLVILDQDYNRNKG